jgi:hypothetical protein
MTTQRNNEQLFARLFRMMDSPFEGEALSAFRQVRRILQEESATFAAILDHTQQLAEINTALGRQNQDLHRENLRLRRRFDRFAFAKTALTRVRQFSSRFTPAPAVAISGGRRSPHSEPAIPRDIKSLIGIFAIIAVTTVSCQLFASVGANAPQRASVAGQLASVATDVTVDAGIATARPESGSSLWQPTKLPAGFSVDHPPWCPACRPQQFRSEASGGPTRLPTNFSIDHPPWCHSCRGQQSHPHADQRRLYERVF